ncbi:MAG: homoaconitase [Pseudomonadota bacterium]
MPQNIVEKITQRFAVGLSPGEQVHAGQFVRVRPFHVMTHDNTGAVLPKFRSLGATRVHDPAQPVFALDHDVQNKDPKNLAKYAAIEAFAREQGIAFFGAGHGIGHQLVVDEGFALPGTLVVASDSHSNLYGGVGALGTPVVRTDAAAIWATGETWWQVPTVVQVILEGSLQPGVSGKDVIIALCGHFNHDEVLNCAVEFAGEGLASLTMDQRLAIANMSTEWGALAGVFPCDEVTRAFLRGRAQVMVERGDARPRLPLSVVEQVCDDSPRADPEAFYSRILSLDLGSVTPHVSGPDEVKRMVALPEIEARHVAIQKAYLLSCVGGRAEDFAAAANVLRGKQVAPGVQLYIAAASREIEDRVRAAGHWQVLVQAGARELPAGCGACIGLGEGLLEAGEVGVSATNRNFKGRMGSREAQVYLASPAVVAASAAAGHIAAPDARPAQELRASFEEHRRDEGQTEVEGGLLDGFPALVEGRVLWLDKNNLNTDGIYGKDYTYKDDLTPEQMAAVAMLNYDPEFQNIARGGDILVAGSNFGSGSSREQAATSLKYRGIRLVIAASFSDTYKRNAFNNGFIVVECPALVEALRARFADSPALTIDTARSARVDFVAGVLEFGDARYRVDALGPAAQELIVAGGLEAVVRGRLLGQDPLADPGT